MSKIGLFNLFKKGSVKAAQKPKVKNDLTISEYTDGDYFISIDSKDFFGKAVSSPSGKYLISAHKKDLVVVDHRKKELVYEYTFKGNLSSFDLLITDDLYFIVIDIGNSQELVNEFFCFGPNGKPVIKKKVNANVQTFGISDDRRYVCCQNANNSDHPDGGSLLIFDTETNELLHRWVPETGWADYYTFETKEKNIILHYDDKGQYRYTFSGELVDKEQWDQTRLGTLNGYQLIDIAEEKINSLESSSNKQLQLSDYQPVIELLAAAVEKDISPYQNAMAYRRLGEIYHTHNDNINALENLKLAIENNPKIGVKRMISKLEKEIDE